MPALKYNCERFVRINFKVSTLYSIFRKVSFSNLNKIAFCGLSLQYFMNTVAISVKKTRLSIT